MHQACWWPTAADLRSASTAGTRSTSLAAAQVHGGSPVLPSSSFEVGVDLFSLPVCAVAYLLGIVMTFAVMLLSGMGQPALLYLVPFTLITAAAVAWYRKEMRQFWTGTTYEVRASQPPIMLLNRYGFCTHISWLPSFQSPQSCPQKPLSPS